MSLKWQERYLGKSLVLESETNTIVDLITLGGAISC